MHPSLWVREAAPLRLPAARPRPRADVVVIGGGVAGVSAALALARRGVGVTLLEAGAIAGRASGRNDGQVLLGLGEHYNRIVEQFGAARARALWAFIADNNRALRHELADHGVDCDFVPGGGLRLAATPHEHDELECAAALMAAEGFAHELWSAADVAARFPAAHGFHGALHLPGEACVQPARMVRALAELAAAAGAEIHERCMVTGVAGGAGEHTVAVAGDIEVEATAVVHCTSTLARELDGRGFLQAQLFPFRGQIIATDPLPAAVAARFPPYAMSSNFCYEYFRLHGARFVAGGMRWSVPGEQQGILDDGGVEPAITTNLRDWVARHFPVLRDVPFPHAWTGIMAGTADGLPLLGALPGQPGVFALAGFNGYGLSFAFRAGQLLAEQIVDGRTDQPAAELFAPRRFAL